MEGQLTKITISELRESFFGELPLTHIEKQSVWNKGYRKYKTKKQQINANRLSGRKSYRKHINERLFYYRQLAHKRRGAIGKHTRLEWEELKKKHNYCCAKCGRNEPFKNQKCKKLTQDHIIPISKGGTNDIKNIQPLCLRCNCRKHNKVQ